jgi:hypothetical protein
MKFLSEEALTWYATDIAPAISTISWAACREQIIARFGPATIHPLIEAQKRYLKREENVKTYFDDKTRLMRQASLDDPAMTAMLTDGMPMAYRTGLISSQPKSPVNWLNIALQLENSYTRQQVPKKPVMVNSVQDGRKFGAQHAKNKQPSTPCRYCLEKGKNELHWHSQCPLRLRRRNDELRSLSDLKQPSSQPVEEAPHEHLN